VQCNMNATSQIQNRPVMRKLADTIARLSALRGRQEPRFSGAARLQAMDDFGSNPGGLKGWTYIPAGLPESAPLVVVLHGCLQTASGYDRGSGWSAVADQEGFALLFPEQQRSNNPNMCFNWFLPEDVRRGDGEALSIRQMIEHTIRVHGVDRRRVFITGLSAGGAMAGAMLATYPEVFAGGAIIAGVPFGSAKTLPEAFDRMRGYGGPTERELGDLVRQASEHAGPWPTVSIWHGTADATVAPSNGREIASQWRAVHNLTAAPTRTETIGRHRRRIWADDDGRDAVEEYTITGMGHGTPLDTGPDGCGAPGPYMLEVDISSTRRLAHLWGLDSPEPRRQKAPLEESTKLPAVTTPLLNYQKAPRRTGSRQGNPADGVRKIIEDALRTAGLM
jgi:poly(hydroxyalkanoate) depolymerase family esterase